MKVLVLLAVGVLVCSLTGAQTVSRCQLINKLKEAMNSPPNATLKKLAEEDLLVARIVCRVVHGSNFSTTVTKLIQSCNQKDTGHGPHQYDRSTHQEPSREDHSNMTLSEENNHGNSSTGHAEHHRRRRDAHKQPGNKEGHHNMTHDVQNNNRNSSTDQESYEHNRYHRSARSWHGSEEGDHNVTPNVQNNNGNSSTENESAENHRQRRAPHYQSAQKDCQNVTLYGIFQLHECVCSNSMNTSKNICGIDCSRLTDANIDDDISCLLKIIADHDENHPGGNHKDRPSHFEHNSREKLKDELYFLNCPELEMCERVKAADYIGGCS